MSDEEGEEDDGDALDTVEDFYEGDDQWYEIDDYVEGEDGEDEDAADAEV